jgi:hypothetical protein
LLPAFGFVAKRIASGRAKLEKEEKTTMEGRFFPDISFCKTNTAKCEKLDVLQSAFTRLLSWANVQFFLKDEPLPGN